MAPAHCSASRAFAGAGGQLLHIAGACLLEQCGAVGLAREGDDFVATRGEHVDGDAGLRHPWRR